MFAKFTYTNQQIEKYYRAAGRDLQIAMASGSSEVAYRFCYDSIVKLAVAICAANGLKVKSRPGHHMALVKKLSQLLGDKDIAAAADNMRLKRNADLYDGGRIFSQKEAAEYLRWTEVVFKKADRYLKEKLNKML